MKILMLKKIPKGMIKASLIFRKREKRSGRAETLTNNYIIGD